MANVPSTSLHEIDLIIQLQHLFSMSSHSDPLRPKNLFSLALLRLYRHTVSNEREDLDKTIVYLTESILLLPLSWPQDNPTILPALLFLASALIERSKVSRQPEDVICATKYFFYLRDWPHEIPNIPRHKITELLVEALALRIQLEAGNVMQDIREMAVLTHELLTLDLPDVDTTSPISLIFTTVMSKIRSDVPDQPFDELIECLRAAKKHKPDLLKGRVALAWSLNCRYLMTLVNDDYEEAMSILDGIFTYSPSGSSQDEFVAKAQASATGIAASLAMARSAAYRMPEYLEEAIYRTRACLNSSSFNEHFPSSVGFYVEATAAGRFSYFGSIEGVKDLSQLLEPETPVKQISDKMMDLLDVIRNNDDTSKIDEAVEKGRSLLASCPDTLILESFGDILEEASLRTNKLEYLNESISIRRQHLETSLSKSEGFDRFSGSFFLFQALLSRSIHFPGRQDLDDALELLSQCVSNASWGATLPNRFRSACLWAYIARLTRHPSVSTAYKTAMSLMQDTSLFSPTLQLQHANLAVFDLAHKMPLDYASYQVGLGQLEEAIETLERGRALLWSEMRHLRTSIDQLLEADPDLSRKFAAVSRELEELTKSVPPSHKLSMDDGAADGLNAVDPFGRLVLKQRRLLKERDKLISQIQFLPSFDHFLAPPSFDTLRSAASSGPVVIINHSRWRSDILILLHNMSPSLIPTPDDFYERAIALKDNLLDSREKDGLDSSQYEQTLASVLADLYKLIGKPVIERLHQLQVPEQSRIWWCPTSVFCSLPFHAMGPIPSGDSEPCYFLDLYICSYTPSLSALIQSRNRDLNSLSSDQPSVLLVAQPDPSLPTVKGEIQVVQALDTEVTSLISEAATPATVIDGFHHHRFVHFACHGTLEVGKPFEAGFELHRDERLTLLEIVRAHLPAAEFVFLSACHTAEMTEGSIMDEGLHLAAAVQYCGFRSVVGTMWAMADEDGRDLAKNFYKAMFSNSRRDQEQLYYTRSAKSLQIAVKRLRKKRWITLERWVNFVHYGA